MHDAGDPFDEDEDEPSGRRDERGFAERVIPDVVKKTLLSGMSAVLLGEEGLRNSITDMKMPKEAMSYIIAQADRTKREAIEVLARELRQFLESLDLQSLLESSLAGTKVEIHTTVQVIQKEEGGVGLEVLEKDTEVTRDATASDTPAAEPEPKKKSTTKRRSSSKRSTKKKKKSAAKKD